MEELRRFVKARLSGRRLEHSLGTEKTARALAETFGGADPKKAAIAGLLHDVARNLDDHGLLQEAARQGIIIREMDRQSPILLHGKVSAAIVKEELGIDDAEILQAISSHVTGRSGWSMLDKIIYLADKCEPTRDYPQVAEIRGMLDKGDFGGALKKALEAAIAYSYKTKSGAVDPETAVVLSEEP